jgi:hypothetical protein
VLVLVGFNARGQSGALVVALAFTRVRRISAGTVLAEVSGIAVLATATATAVLVAVLCRRLT